ncbi:AEC family transporter [Paracoccus fistulariae]|uniref:AEC family transporter n=1 Tax=Paracoccus fistulariae TaxID=658446 RepID=A0ABY7SMB9_9RHOB|nr:AEC family transporter [Paracoccus fistulariae]MDB6180650.1 AEC family transporter [Paracoccus fistulariae]WCR07116.1 AEC family transporter [Paracoccus fistulariae]
MSALFTIILPVFLVIGFGYLVAWRGLFSPSGVDSLMKFAQSFAVPTLLFSSMAKLDLGADFRLNLLLPFYAGAFASYLIGWAGAKFWFRRPPMDCVAIGFVCLFSNSLLLGIPITERAYGTEALDGNWTIIALHSPMLYTFGITVMEFTRARGSGLSVGRVALTAVMGVLRTPMVIGILCGVVMNVLMQAGLVMPDGFWGAVDMMARAALPAALFGLGGILVRYRPEGDMMAIALCCICALLIHPAITLSLATLGGLDVAGLRSAVLTAAMAPGVNAFLFADLYGSARRVAASSVLLATALSILTIWMWLAILP